MFTTRSQKAKADSVLHPEACLPSLSAFPSLLLPECLFSCVTTADYFIIKQYALFSTSSIILDSRKIGNFILSTLIEDVYET